MSKKSMPILAQWIEPECTIDDERSVGVTVARKVKLNGIDYEGAVTVEVFGTLGRHSNGALDDDWPETWSGDESATLTPGGARRLAHILTVAADTAYAYRKEIGVAHAEVTPKQSTIDKAVAAEREACAAIADDHARERRERMRRAKRAGSEREASWLEDRAIAAEDVATEIRARSTTAHEKRVISADLFAGGGTARDGAK